jgi:transcription elongation factor GreA
VVGRGVELAKLHKIFALCIALSKQILYKFGWQQKARRKLMYKFFKEDLDALDFKIKELRKTIREAGQQMGAATEDGEREHDNPELDDAMRRFEMWSKHLREMNEIRGKAEIVEPSDVSGDKASIGCTITFVDQDENEKTVSIGSYMPSEASTEISYNAPIARILIGLKVGEYREGKIAGQDVEFEVTRIEVTKRRH